MTKLLVCLLFAAAVVAANPFVETYLSEVGVDSAYQFVELNCAPQPQSVDLSGWQIITSTSVCTLTCYLRESDLPLVVDSEALAWGEVGHGKIRIAPLGDSVLLIDDTGVVEDHVHFPRYPTGHDCAPLPPSHGSIAFWNYDDAEDQSMNWYVDSIPSPGWPNGDYSTIAGTISGTGGVTLDEICLDASGTHGHCHRGLWQQTSYSICGLGAGTYQVTAWATYNGHVYDIVYPESVTVRYSQVVGGIDFVIPLIGVAETPSAPLLPSTRVSGQALLLTSDGTAPVDVQLYNQVGSRVSSFDLGPIKGEKRIELPATLTPGVYFASCRFGERTLRTKIVLY